MTDDIVGAHVLRTLLTGLNLRGVDSRRYGGVFRAARRPVDSELADELLAFLAPDPGPGPSSDGWVGQV
ncbi:hypothetical protein ACWD6R_21150 [Streptomyces sp. NPDC005151]